MLLNPAPELVPEPGPDTSSQGPDLTEPSVTAESLFGTAVEGDIFIREVQPTEAVYCQVFFWSVISIFFFFKT